MLAVGAGRPVGAVTAAVTEIRAVAAGANGLAASVSLIGPGRAAEPKDKAQ